MMGTCRDIELELAAYCGGELGPAEETSVREHLNLCSACRAELARERQLREVLGGLPQTDPAPELDNRILAAVRSETVATGFPVKRSRLTIAAALIAATMALAFLWPALRPAADQNPAWTDQEIAAARRDVLYSLALTARVIDRTRKDTVVDVFADKLPRAINDSFKIVRQTTSGGNG